MSCGSILSEFRAPERPLTSGTSLKTALAFMFFCAQCAVTVSAASAIRCCPLLHVVHSAFLLEVAWLSTAFKRTLHNKPPLASESKPASSSEGCVCQTTLHPANPPAHPKHMLPINLIPRILLDRWSQLAEARARLQAAKMWLMNDRVRLNFVRTLVALLRCKPTLPLATSGRCN